MIHDAAEANDVARIRDLVATHPDSVNFRSDLGCSALWLASAKGATEAVCALAELGSDVESANNSGTSALFVAALTGHVDTVRALVRLGADKDSQRPGDLGTPLLAAVIGGHLDVLQELVCFSSQFY